MRYKGGAADPGRTLTPKLRAQRAREWCEWRKRDPVTARNGFVFLRNFKKQLLKGLGEWATTLW